MLSEYLFLQLLTNKISVSLTMSNKNKIKTKHYGTPLWVVVMMCLSLIVSSCRVTRHIPEGENVVSRVSIKVDGKPSSSSSMKMAVQQKPYHRTFGFLPIPTWMWHNDTTTAWHRWRNKVGTEPILYDEAKSLSSENAMIRSFNSQGYLYAKASHYVKTKNGKAKVTYNIEKGEPKLINEIKILVEDPNLDSLVINNTRESVVKKGNLLDRNRLEEERIRLTSLMRNNGYWDFNKDNISFIADTLQGEQNIDLTVILTGLHEKYYYNNVHFLTNFNVTTNSNNDSIKIDDKTLRENCFIIPGNHYTETSVQDTYSAFSHLHILKYTNIRIEPHEDNLLDVYVYTTPQTPKTISFELDGTNTAGDLGFAASLNFQHRNIFRGSETYSLGLKAGYEAISGNIDGLVNNNYSEYTIDNRLEIPKFIVPFLSSEEKRKRKASTSVKLSFSYQMRPEYTRLISNAGLGYKWQTGTHQRHTFNLIDLSYVFLPERSESFIAIIEQAGPISYSSYSSHLIMAMNYTYNLSNQVITNRKIETSRDVWSLRVNAEIAGNLLMAISKMAKLKKDKNGNYNIFGLPFEQYARLDADWSYSKYLNDRSRLAYHVACGIAIPYGNSETVPFEKRYYAGGANSVRGWSVRTLGPGVYHNTQESSRLDFFNQCGDIRFDAAVELRSKLFWKLELAAFFDAGNVWTIKDYPSQKGGLFTSDFYKQIATSTGLGLRMVTDFVVLRLDLGLKVYNPYKEGSDVWAIQHPFYKENRTIHFAVGYPF